MTCNGNCYKQNLLYKHRCKVRYFTFFWKYKKHVFKMAKGHVKYSQLSS